MPTPQADSPPIPNPAPGSRLPAPASLIRNMAAEPQTIRELSRALKARHTTAEAIVDACLERIAERNPTLNAFITVFDDDARKQARDADREIAAGRHRGPLHGVPISLKDLFDVRGAVTTAASR